MGKRKGKSGSKSRPKVATFNTKESEYVYYIDVLDKFIITDFIMKDSVFTRLLYTYVGEL